MSGKSTVEISQDGAYVSCLNGEHGADQELRQTEHPKHLGIDEQFAITVYLALGHVNVTISA